MLKTVPEKFFKQGDLQFLQKVKGTDVEIYYDDYVSARNPENMYALFTEKGFHGWLKNDFTMTEINFVVSQSPLDYEKEKETKEDS